ncbi:MAG: hypothetical protein KatS3mg088_299 [Patescibacteria group bacterium]|nr:MAG: hypothetical protein KatS3mg088_299 [Patescibacteria group bacterium]
MAIKGISGRIWQVRSVLRSESKIDLNKIISLLLKNRGIEGKVDQENFLNPPHPSKLKAIDFDLNEGDIKKAISVMNNKKEEGKKIIIYGDYDADGITGSAILWEALYSRGFDVLPYIPDRAKEGYGIRSESVAKLKKKYTDLGMIITVDNGITSFDEVGRVKEMGIDVIIVDHHKKDRKLPPADVIVHSDKVAGCGVSWFLSQCLKKEIRAKNSFYDNDGLDLLVIGTIADQMDLTGINRSLVKHGIRALNETKRKGLLEVFKEAGIKRGGIGTYEINYVIAPRINAMGRISHAMDSLRLLCTKDQEKARELALHLGRINKERQKMVDELLVKSKEKAEKELENKALVIVGRDYNEGIIGLVAGKLVEEFYRPTVVISKRKGISKASARSVSGFDITEELRQWEEIFESLGGHPMAAGFSIETGKIGDFKKKFINYANKTIDKSILEPRLLIDMKIDFDLIDDKLVEILLAFEPLGMGNPSPLFLAEKVRIVDIKKIGQDGKHLKFVLSQSDKIFEAVAFGFGNLELVEIKPNSFLDIVFSVGKNLWNGFESIQLNVKDLGIN